MEREIRENGYSEGNEEVADSIKISINRIKEYLEEKWEDDLHDTFFLSYPIKYDYFEELPGNPKCYVWKNSQIEGMNEEEKIKYRDDLNTMEIQIMKEDLKRKNEIWNHISNNVGTWND
jgi:hypothetical protein